MPVIKQHISVAARGIKAFLNLEAGVGRVEPSATPNPEPKKRPAANGAPFRPAAQPAGHPRSGSVRPEKILWIFGSGRSGSTWLSTMMGEVSNQSLWGEPWVGTLFGNFYYSTDERKRRIPQFILGPHRRGPIRNFLLDAAAVTFPDLGENFLVIKEPNGSVGAPLLMEALPESRMVLLVRDPRDVVASALDGRREGGWHYQRNKERLYSERKEPPKKDSVAFAEGRAQNYVEGMGNAKKAYDAHEGPKVLIRYEELRTDTVGTMMRLYSTLGVPVDKEEIARVVEKHSWENIPEEKKGEGKFYRKGKPGGWKEDLTPEQAETIERVTAPLLEELYPEKV